LGEVCATPCSEDVECEGHGGVFGPHCDNGFCQLVFGCE
jgi:hypothetical protein